MSNLKNDFTESKYLFKALLNARHTNKQRKKNIFKNEDIT